MAKFTQQAMEAARLGKKFDDERAVEFALAGLEGDESKEAKQERQFLQRRLDAIAQRAAQRGEVDALTPEQLAARVRR